jgi:hypothetical protein
MILFFIDESVQDGKVLIACSYDGNIAALNFSDIDLGHSLTFVEKDKLFKVR